MHQDQEQVIGLWINLAATHKVPEKYVLRSWLNAVTNFSFIVCLAQIRQLWYWPYFYHSITWHTQPFILQNTTKSRERARTTSTSTSSWSITPAWLKATGTGICVFAKRTNATRPPATSKSLWPRWGSPLPSQCLWVPFPDDFWIQISAAIITVSYCHALFPWQWALSHFLC